MWVMPCIDCRIDLLDGIFNKHSSLGCKVVPHMPYAVFIKGGGEMTQFFRIMKLQ